MKQTTGFQIMVILVLVVLSNVQTTGQNSISTPKPTKKQIEISQKPTDIQEWEVGMNGIEEIIPDADEIKEHKATEEDYFGERYFQRKKDNLKELKRKFGLNDQQVRVFQEIVDLSKEVAEKAKFTEHDSIFRDSMKEQGLEMSKGQLEQEKNHQAAVDKESKKLDKKLVQLKKIIGNKKNLLFKWLEEKRSVLEKWG